MRFEDFARLHGLIIRELIPYKWVAVPTEDHPRKRNGRYKFMGDVGWVQNWATMQAPEIWRPDVDSISAPDMDRIKHDRAAAERERMIAAERAAQKAGWILHQCKLETHPYLAKKGFEKETGNVWTTDDGSKLLVIPMRIGTKLVGAQLIDDKGTKKFLHGQVTKGASFTLDARGIPIFCEGYATALSIRAVMRVMKVRYTIVCCFSASNLKHISGGIDGGIIVADNDASGVGEQVAKDTGKPYWLSEAVGEDFNDFHTRVGLFHAMNSLKVTCFPSVRLSSA